MLNILKRRENVPFLMRFLKAMGKANSLKKLFFILYIMNTQSHSVELNVSVLIEQDKETKIQLAGSFALFFLFYTTSQQKKLFPYIA